MNFKDLQWHIPSIHGSYNLKIQDIDKGYRISKGKWNGFGFVLAEGELNPNEYVECFQFCGIIKN